MPKVGELTSAYATAATAVGRVDYRSFKTQQEARDEYFRIIGEKPLLAFTSSGENPPERKVKRPSFGQSAARAMGH